MGIRSTHVSGITSSSTCRWSRKSSRTGHRSRRKSWPGLANIEARGNRWSSFFAGAGGFRIGEALGIEIDKHLSADCSTISIKQKARHGQVEGRLKTPSAIRQVDLHPEVAKLLKAFIGTRTSWTSVPDQKWQTAFTSNILRRHLHPALKELGYVNPTREITRRGPTRSGVSATRT